MLRQRGRGRVLRMNGRRLAITFAAVACLLADAWAADREFHLGCMGIQSFSAWSDTQVFPYRASSQRRSAIRRGFKQIGLGAGLDRVKVAMPPPDWAVETQQGCIWKFATKISNAKDADQYEGVVLGLREAKVVMLGKEKNPWEIVQH
jgi:hypothetical protein